MSSQSHLMRTHCYGEVARTIVVHGKRWLIRVGDDRVTKRPKAGVTRLFEPVKTVLTVRFDTLRQLIRRLFQIGQDTAHGLIQLLECVHFRFALDTACWRWSLCRSPTSHRQKLDWNMVLLWIVILVKEVTAIVNLALPNVSQLFEKIQGLCVESTRQ